MYSDSDEARIECPFPLGRLDSLYTISWRCVVGEIGVPLANGTRGVYWLAEENNRTLHVNTSAAPDLSYICAGAVQTCRTTSTSSCIQQQRNSPNITINMTTGRHITFLSLRVNLRFMHDGA